MSWATIIVKAKEGAKWAKVLIWLKNRWPWKKPEEGTRIAVKTANATISVQLQGKDPSVYIDVQKGSIVEIRTGRNLEKVEGSPVVKEIKHET